MDLLVASLLGRRPFGFEWDPSRGSKDPYLGFLSWLGMSLLPWRSLLTHWKETHTPIFHGNLFHRNILIPHLRKLIETLRLSIWSSSSFIWALQNPYPSMDLLAGLLEMNLSALKEIGMGRAWTEPRYGLLSWRLLPNKEKPSPYIVEFDFHWKVLIFCF